VDQAGLTPYTNIKKITNPKNRPKYFPWKSGQCRLTFEGVFDENGEDEKASL
jgi:hypothetical protein